MNSERLQETVKAIVLQGFEHEFGKPAQPLAPDPEWQKLRNAGTRLWLDTGDIEESAKLFTAEFDALTTNNTLLNNEIQKGIYDDFIPQVAAGIRAAVPRISEEDLLLEISFVLNARHALRLVDRFDARVSVELHTDLASDVDRSVAYARRYHEICPERFIIKIPLTPAGLLAARKVALLGIDVNFTLGFSARQNYVAALISNPAYVNVFMGRLGSFIAEAGLGTGDGFGEKATLATQREILAIRDSGRSRSRLIGASMRNPAQVPALAGIDVFTMPPKVAAGYRALPSDHISSRVSDDPSATLNEGASLEDFAGGSLWEVPDEFRDAVEKILVKDIDEMRPEDVQGHFETAGFRDFLPRWTMQEITVITHDGKIPVFQTWAEGLAGGIIALDSLMNISALQSFVTDQAALDARVSSLI